MPADVSSSSSKCRSSGLPSHRASATDRPGWHRPELPPAPTSPPERGVVAALLPATPDKGRLHRRRPSSPGTPGVSPPRPLHRSRPSRRHPNPSKPSRDSRDSSSSPSARPPAHRPSTTPPGTPSNPPSRRSTSPKTLISNRPSPLCSRTSKLRASSWMSIPPSSNNWAAFRAASARRLMSCLISGGISTGWWVILNVVWEVCRPSYVPPPCGVPNSVRRLVTSNPWPLQPLMP
mmetsp:Transcript_36929/g.80857  ORF Transcript_36929/g.80857 Transcript_36929/m.80857 type:complete len:234 (-) Transcript_36929:119-820(-)